MTAGAACSCSDTVGNLKVGHMVGANPRKQFIAQIFGVFAGSLLAVPAYFILVPDATALGGEKFPAPSALVWMFQKRCWPATVVASCIMTRASP